MLVLTAGILLAAALGIGLSLVLVVMLQHVFDPPPDQLVMLWRFLFELGGCAVTVGVLAGLVSPRRLPLGSLLRET